MGHHLALEELRTLYPPYSGICPDQGPGNDPEARFVVGPFTTVRIKTA